MTISEIITITINSISSVATAIAAFLIYYQIKSTHDWNRRKTSQEVLNSLINGDFPKDLNKFRIIVKDKLNADMQERNKNYNDLISVCTKEELREINSAVISIINTLETISVYVKNSIVDEDICYNFSYTFFIDLYYWLNPYILECRKRELNEFILAEYEYYAKKWEVRLNQDKKIKDEFKVSIVKAKNRL